MYGDTTFCFDMKNNSHECGACFIYSTTRRCVIRTTSSPTIAWRIWTSPPDRRYSKIVKSDGVVSPNRSRICSDLLAVDDLKSFEMDAAFLPIGHVSVNILTL
jgi:hypothetical protein